MNWYSETPGETGWYWLREFWDREWQEPEIVHLVNIDDRTRVMFCSGRREDLRNIRGEWLGPLEPQP